eukprot:41611-Amphidinium_carterae.1
MRSAGEAERAVQSTAGMVRTLKAALELKAGIKVEPGMVLFEWMVKYATVLLNLFQIGADGNTPFKRLRGKSWRMPLPAFGERVEFKTRPSNKAEPTWRAGVYLGIQLQSSEKVVANAEGVYLAHSLQRRDV